jgi:hypothetical protein
MGEHAGATPRTGSLRLGWGLAAAAVVSLGVGTGFYLSAADHFDTRDQWLRQHFKTDRLAQAKSAYAHAQSAHDDGLWQAWTGYALVGTGAILAGAAVWAFWFRAPPDGEALSRWHLVPSPEGLGVMGRF